MRKDRILFTSEGKPMSPDAIRYEIGCFRDAYMDATHEIIQDSKELDKKGEAFIKCTSRLLSSFGMTRSGPFKKGVNKEEKLLDCWSKVGSSIIEIKYSIFQSGLSRNRLLLELDNHSREDLIEKIWVVFKRLLPLTMGGKAYGLVGASKILFAVLPEIALPIDNSQWLQIFRTVDFGDVIKWMASDIQHWESSSGEKLNEMDNSGRLTTLPSVYNIMAMAARPKKTKGKDDLLISS
jgi:hypothetical protein